MMEIAREKVTQLAQKGVIDNLLWEESTQMSGSYSNHV